MPTNATGLDIRGGGRFRYINDRRGSDDLRGSSPRGSHRPCNRFDYDADVLWIVFYE